MQISSAIVSGWWCDDEDSVITFEPAAILSMLFATLLMMIDFIIPCVTDKKVSNIVLQLYIVVE